MTNENNILDNLTIEQKKIYEILLALFSDLQDIGKKFQVSKVIKVDLSILNYWVDRAYKKISESISKDEAEKLYYSPKIDSRNNPNSFITERLEQPQNKFIRLFDSYQRQLIILIQEFIKNPDDIIEISTKRNDIIEVDALSNIERICSRFHNVVKQLRKRHDNRETLDIKDEYDVQDLLHSLLHLYFDDIRPEETTPSKAGKSARIDFLLKEENIIIETKMTRKELTEKKLGDEILVDIARYKEHSNCNTFICFIYDPEGRISNPAGFTSDLSSESTDDFSIIIFIEPT